MMDTSSAPAIRLGRSPNIQLVLPSYSLCWPTKCMAVPQRRQSKSGMADSFRSVVYGIARFEGICKGGVPREHRPLSLCALMRFLPIVAFDEMADEEIDKNLSRIHQYPPFEIHIRKIHAYPQMHYSRI